jgi:uncharacterized protein YkwD
LSAASLKRVRRSGDHQDMGRVVSLAVAALCAVVAAGCGAAADRVADRAAAPVAGPATVENTDGRLGDATTVRPGSPARELSRGGRPDLRPRDDAPRRDGVGAGTACANPAPAPDALGPAVEATLCLLNGERADHGLAPLAGNAMLGAAAVAHANDLVAGSYFSHTGRDGSGVYDRIERSGYIRRGHGWVIGENLAWGTGALAMPESIMQAWMNSPGHRANILNPSYREIGIGIVAGNPAQSDGAGATYATEFGVIEGPDAEAVATAPQRKARAKKAVKRHRREGRKAHVSRRGGKGRGKHRRARSRGPKAHISI